VTIASAKLFQARNPETHCIPKPERKIQSWAIAAFLRRGTVSLFKGWALVFAFGYAISLFLPALKTQADDITLYEVATDSESLPSDQGWDVFSIPGQAVIERAPDWVVLDTMAEAGEVAGWIRFAPISLSDTPGYVLKFSVQLFAEAHISEHRSGFSVLILNSDMNGIELGFWTNSVWAQSDNPLFHRAETATYDTTQLQTYELEIVQGTYTLRVDEDQVLAGVLRNYTEFTGPLNPYKTPNLIFFGDNTRSAAARVGVQRISWHPKSGPPVLDLGLAWRRAEDGLEVTWKPDATLELQTTFTLHDLNSWHKVDAVDGGTGIYQVTDGTWADGIMEGARWFRLVQKSSHSEP
jgi:hypothetical protein